LSWGGATFQSGAGQVRYRCVTTLTLGCGRQAVRAQPEYRPGMRSASASVRIQRPRAAVHALLVDLARREEFLDHFLGDWTVTSADARGVGATARLRAKGGGSGDELETEIVEVSPQRVAEEARGGRRRWRLRYELDEVTATATQVRFTIELVACSPLDRATWPLMRSHLERQYGQALLRLKRVLESEAGTR